jgi:hypothetical protein
VPDGKTNAQFAYEYLTASGLSPQAATGVVGNLMAESSMNTRAIGDGGKAKGIAQWHPDRWNPFVAWAQRARRDPYSLEAQLYWLRKEAGTSAGGNVWSRLKGVKSVQEAAALWMRLFERPADQSDAAAARRAAAGVAAVKGGQTLTAPGATPDDPNGSLLGSVTEPITAGIQGAAGTLVEGAKPLLVKGVFALLAVGLIGAGAWQATKGAR